MVHKKGLGWDGWKEEDDDDNKNKEMLELFRKERVGLVWMRRRRNG